MKYFNNCQTLEELKKEYRRLAMKHHPDRGGDTATMQAINSEYEQLFPIFKLKHNQTAEVPTHETAQSDMNEFYTQNGWKGSNYKLSRTTKECAAEIRAYLKRAYPDCKFSVTTSYASMCSSIYVYLMSGPYDALRTKDHHDVNQYYVDRDTELTEWGKAVMIDVNDCIKSYHFSDCDGMIDYFHVNFYYSIGVARWDKPYSINTKAKKLAAAEADTEEKPQEAVMPSQASGVLRVVMCPEHDGVEVYFPGKPSAETRNALKAAGFRWHGTKKCWYAKRTENHLQALKSIEAAASHESSGYEKIGAAC